MILPVCICFGFLVAIVGAVNFESVAGVAYQCDKIGAVEMIYTVGECCFLLFEN